jgi:hypothetical protein
VFVKKMKEGERALVASQYLDSTLGERFFRI